MKTRVYIILTIFSSIIFLSCQNRKDNTNMSKVNTPSILRQTDTLASPVADKEPKSTTLHGVTWTDDYFWMRLSDEQKNAKTPDAQTQKVIQYLQAENDYRSARMKPLADFEGKLFEEMKSRIKQDDQSVPYFLRGYHYITRYEEGKEYAIYSRKKETLDAKEEIMLDANALAKGHEFYTIGSRVVSPDNNLLAYAEDNVGRRQYTLKVKNLTTGTLYQDQIKNTSGSVVWANDNKTIFYTINDDALRSYKVMKHVLGTPVEKDVLVYHEKDDTYSTYIFKTKSQKYLVIANHTTLANEYLILDANNPNGKFTLFNPRTLKLEYDIEHYQDKWLIRTNADGAENFKIMTCPEMATAKSNWKDYLPYNPAILTEGLEVFNDFLVISERKEGMTQIRVRNWDGKHEHSVAFDEAAYTVYPGANPEFNSATIRLEYTSMTTPSTTYEYNPKSKEKKVLKQQEVVGGYNPSDYMSERKMVKATDGTMVPLTIVYKKGFEKNGTSPFLLYGYGSYGYSMDPYFSASRLSLLNRGFGFAIAHIRGGQEMGRQWYENGKYFKKKNTFTDFIDCGKYLVQEKYAASDHLYAQGGSAGGLLMGAVMNMQPDLWAGIVADVPFVDVINTMLDESIPLTTGEFDEWGNPKKAEYFAYIRSYSPYDNVEAKAYPPLLVTTGYWDSQVQYWEPAKWVAKLRALKTDKNPMLMYTNMDAGHGGASGRFQRLKEVAMQYTFFLDLAGKIDQ